MFYSSWIIQIDTNDKVKANDIYENAICKLNIKPSFKQISINNPHGNLIHFEACHDTESWAHFIYELLSISEAIGFGWRISGPIDKCPSALASDTNIIGAKSVSWSVNDFGESEYT